MKNILQQIELWEDLWQLEVYQNYIFLDKTYVDVRFQYEQEQTRLHWRVGLQ